MMSKICQKKVTCLVLAMVMCVLSACSGYGAQQQMKIETAYGPLVFPKTLEDVLVHKEVAGENGVEEIFYMEMDGEEKEIFRIIFGESSEGTRVGYLYTQDDVVAISYSVCAYLGEDFNSAEVRDRYYAAMDGFNEAVNKLCEDERFSNIERAELGAQREVTLRYWTVQLPETVTWEEIGENSEYRVDFYGKMGDDKIELYSVGFDEAYSDYDIGYMKVDDTVETVYVKIHDSPIDQSWTEEEQNIFYRLMETLDNVVNSIVNNKAYFEDGEI